MNIIRMLIKNFILQIKLLQYYILQWNMYYCILIVKRIKYIFICVFWKFFLQGIIIENFMINSIKCIMHMTYKLCVYMTNCNWFTHLELIFF